MYRKTKSQSLPHFALHCSYCLPPHHFYFSKTPLKATAAPLHGPLSNLQKPLFSFFPNFARYFSPVTDISSAPKVQFCRIHWKTNISKLSQNPNSLKCKRDTAGKWSSVITSAITRIQHRGNFLILEQPGTAQQDKDTANTSHPGMH